MKRPELYKKTCDILYDAYFNDMLSHGNCQACAVGNIIAANTNQKEGGRYYCANVSWSIIVRNANCGGNKETAIKQIEASGYSARELQVIELAFERCKYSINIDETMFNGLCAVIEVLNKIHEVETDTQTERFKKHFHSKTINQ